MKITTRGVDPELWKEAKKECIVKGTTLGRIINESLAARYLKPKEEKSGKADD